MIEYKSKLIKMLFITTYFFIMENFFLKKKASNQIFINHAIRKTIKIYIFECITYLEADEETEG